jgi:hypothetical protein
MSNSNTPEFLLELYLQPEDVVIRKLKTKGYSSRVASIDDGKMILTCDFNPRRANLTIKNGLVTRITLG